MLRGISRFVVVGTGAALLIAALTAPSSADDGDYGRISGKLSYSDGATPTGTLLQTAYSRLVDGKWQGEYVINQRGSTWSINNLKAGTYKVEFRKASPYLSEKYNPYGDLDPVEITIASDEESDGHDVVLDLPATLSGTLTDQDGAPIDGWAAIYRRDHSGEWRSAAYSQETGADGTYFFGGLHPGDYTVRFSKSGFRTEYHGDTTSLDDAAVVHVNANESHPGVDASLDPGATVRGTVIDSRDEPVTGAHVSLTGGGATTGEDGGYTITGAQPGDRQLKVQPKDGDDLAASTTPVIVGTTQSTVDVVLKDGAHLKGHVTDADGNPVSGAIVTIHRPADAPKVDVASTTTDQHGDYLVTGLDSEAYIAKVRDAAQVWDTRFSGDAATFADAVPVTATAGQTATSDLVLPIRGTIAGVVVDGEGAALDGVSVSAISGNLVARSTTTAADGTYELRLESGTEWKLKFSDIERQRFPAQFHDDIFDLLKASRITVASGATTVVDSTLRGLRVQPSYTPAAIRGGTAVGVALTAQVGTWQPENPDFTFLWLRDGTRIIGATGKTYRLTHDDLGKRISVRITASKADYRPGIVTVETDEPVRLGRFHGADVSLSDQSDVHYGQALSADGATAHYPGAAVTYQWFRDGVAITGATGRVRRLTSADPGHDVSVKASLSAPGHRDTTIASTAARVYPAISTTKVSAQALSNRRVRIEVTVRAPGVATTALDGKVRVRTHEVDRDSITRTFTIKDGRVVVVLDRQRRGQHGYWAVFAATSSVVGDPSAYAYVTIR